MKTKLGLIGLLMIFNIFIVNGQTLSKEVRNDFCINAKYNYFYGTNSFYGLMNLTLKKIGISDPYKMDEAVKNICNDELLQNSFFESVYNVSGGLDKQQYLIMGMKYSNVEKLIEYYNVILNYKREKERHSNKLNELTEIHNKISNNELFFFNELVNRPELKIVDSINVREDVKKIISTMFLNVENERFVSIYPLFFEVDSSGKIVGLANKKNNESRSINLESLKFNENGFVINKNSRVSVPFYYPFKISLNSSSNYKEIDVTVRLIKGKVLIERINKSPYASSPAGRISFEKSKSLDHFEELKRYILNEKPLRTTKSSFFNNTYRTFKVHKNTLNVSLIIDEDKNIYQFNDTTFNISEIGN